MVFVSGPLALANGYIQYLDRHRRLNHALILAVKDNDNNAVQRLLLQGADPSVHERAQKQYSLWQQLQPIFGQTGDDISIETPLKLAKNREAELKRVLFEPVRGYDQPEMLHCQEIINMLEKAGAKD